MMENGKTVPRWRFALKSAGWHLLISLSVAGLAVLLVFKVWYPYPYAELTGGLSLYQLVVAVDIVCGPLLTLILASPKKKTKARMVDFSMVGIIQLAALVYGLHSVSLARPVVEAFEQDRMTIVTAAEVVVEDLHKAPEGLQSLSWFGIRRIALKEPEDADEKNKTLDLSLKGIEPSMRPDQWLPYSDKEAEEIRKHLKPLKVLADARKTTVADILKQAGLAEGEELYYLPFTSSRQKEWIVITDKEGNTKGYAPIDGFIITP
ncbi:TPA: fimb protein [Neisseria meningitidis]